MSVIKRAREWADQDPDPNTRATVEALLDAGNISGLEEIFGGPLTFGTAGIRAPMGAGSNRMNRVSVARTAAGLAAWLSNQITKRSPRIVIGCDARHQSEVFARDIAEICAGAGLEAMLLPPQIPTPVLSYAIRFMGVDAGVMVTASHNPASDNGIKVYLDDSAQISWPADAEITDEIAKVGAVNELPRNPNYEPLSGFVAMNYVKAVAKTIAPGPRDIKVVHTALHGVSTDTFKRACEAVGFPSLVSTVEQVWPDPDFPTTPLPNPEEPGALDLAIDTARKCCADLIVAHDPDADRCAVAVRVDDDYRVLTGDQLGILLADSLLRKGAQGAFASSIVSSSMLEKLAAKYGQSYVPTLTGFKWIARVPELAYGYEEAIGYCVAPDICLDKDGISAALRALELAAELKVEGKGLWDRLVELSEELGWHATASVAVRFDDPAESTALLERFGEAPPQELAGHWLQDFEDLEKGFDGLPPTAGVRAVYTDDVRLIVRPSGTEPKLKCYVQKIAEDQTDAESELADIIEDLNDWIDD